jgi:hypothetical protein
MMMRSTKTTTDMRVQSHESNLLTGGVPSSLNRVYVVSGTLMAARRAVLDAFGAAFSARHKAFVSHAQAPRAPNINVSVLKDEMASAEDGFLEAFATGAQLAAYVEWVGGVAAEVGDPAVVARARAKSAADPMFLRALPGVRGWVSMPAARAWAAGDVRGARGLVEDAAVGARAPPSARTLPKAVRMAVWRRWVGEDRAVSACFACGAAILLAREWEAGHVVAKRAGGSDAVDNLRPVCATCNRSMGTRSMTEFRAQFFE